MYKVKETIVSRGYTDKIKLSRFYRCGDNSDKRILRIFRDRILESIKKMADETGIVILTDSDSARL